MPSENSVNRRWRGRDAAWLCLAVLVHLSLLLIPVKQPEPQSATQPVLTVSLEPFLEEEMKSSEITQEIPREPIEPTTDHMTEARPEEAESENEPEPVFVDSNDQAQEEEELLPNAALLFDSIAFIEKEESESETGLRLGAALATSIPANWRQGTGTGAAKYSENWFEGMVLPRSTEILDRWQSTDGSQNVVVNLSKRDDDLWSAGGLRSIQTHG